MSHPHLPLPFLALFAALTFCADHSSALAQPPQAGIRNLDWTRLPARYTHSDQGLRVDQFAKAPEPLSNERPDFVRSGYRHYRSTLQAGTSADNLHVVEEWGNPVRPYDEWRFPFRPYSAPYPMWGPQPVPFGGLGAFPTPYPFANPQGFNVPANFQATVPTYPPSNPNNGPGNNNPGNTNPNTSYLNNTSPYNPWQYSAPAWSNPPWANGMWPNIDEIPQPRDEDFFRRPQSGSN